MADLENGPSERDQYETEPDEEGLCPTHGPQRVVGYGSTGGPDPYQVEKLACGHHVIAFGSEEEDLCIINP